MTDNPLAPALIKAGVMAWAMERFLQGVTEEVRMEGLKAMRPALDDYNREIIRLQRVKDTSVPKAPKKKPGLKKAKPRSR